MVVVPIGAGDGGGSAGPGGGGKGGRGGGAGRVKGSWTPEEDELLRRAVAQHGPRNWSVISAEIPGRSGKSCRLRWCNQLSPGVERRPFTPDEDAVIVAAHAQYGNKWATIARMLHGRTDNSVKNHWNSTLRRQRRAAAAAAAAAANGAGAGAGLVVAGCALPLRPLAAAVIVPGPAAPLRHLLSDPKDPSPAPPAAVPFQHDDDEEDDEDEDDDGSSEDSVLKPPPKKRHCGGIGAGHTQPSPGVVAKKPEYTKPQPPTVTPPAPAEPLTSLTLSLPGGGGGGGAVPETPAPQAAAEAAVATTDGALRMRAMLEQDCPWLLPLMRQMICEEVQRQLPCLLAASPAGTPGRSSASGADGRAAANGQD